MTNEEVKVILLKTDTIKPYNRNARKNDVTVQKLCEIIPKVGFNQPIVVDKNNVIVKGHARWKAAVKLGLERVPVIVSTNDDETNKLDRLADNKLSEFSQWDDEILQTELASINIPDLDMSDFGFDFDIAGLNYPIGQAVFAPVEPHNASESAGNVDHGESAYNATEPAYARPEPDSNYITEKDVQRTVPNNNPEYGHVMCPNCGATVLYKKN